MQPDTKFMRIPLAATVGSRFGEWQVTWIGGWDKWRLYYLVMVVRPPQRLGKYESRKKTRKA
jgi:hypothetical protein